MILKKIISYVKKYLWLILIIVVFLGARWFYTRDGIKTVSVKILEPQDRVIEKTVSTSGLIKSQNSADLSFNSTGRVTSILVQEGDQVTKGQLLATLNSSSLQQTAQSLKDARDIAIRNKEIFVEQYDKNRDRIGGEADYQINLRKYDELISQAEATYQAQLNNLSNYYIYAPVNGVIVDVTKEVGENSAINEKVISINNLENTIFEVEVDQEDFGLLSVGQQVRIELDAYENYEFNGTVSKLPLFVNEQTNSRFLVEVEVINNTDFKPLVGMTGDARIIVNKTDNPVASVFYDEIFYDSENNPYVFVLKDNFIKRQDITIGLEGDIYTEIVSDITDQIVVGVNDDVELQEGYKAKVVDL